MATENEQAAAGSAAPTAAEPAQADPDALKAEKAEIAAWKANQDKIKANPAAVLDVYGLTIEQVAEAYLRTTAGTAEPTAEERLAALEAEKAARLKADEDARKD